MGFRGFWWFGVSHKANAFELPGSGNFVYFLSIFPLPIDFLVGFLFSFLSTSISLIFFNPRFSIFIFLFISI